MKMGARKWYVGLVIGLSIAVLTLLYFTGTNDERSSSITPSIENGVLDLAFWDSQQDKVFNLDGVWEFYWEALLTIDEIQNVKPSADVQLPHEWAGYEIDENNTLTSYGYATYRLQVRNAPMDESLAIKFSTTPNAYQVFIDHELIAENSVVGEYFIEDHKPKNTPITASFRAPNKDFDLIIHISNHDYSFGGLWNVIQFGLEENILALNTLLVQKDSILFGALLIMALYYLSFYIFLRKDLLNLLFALGCIFFIFRMSLLGERTLLGYFPDISFDTMLVLVHFFYVIAPIPFMLLINYLFPKESNSLPIKLFILISSMYFIMLSFMPIYASSLFMYIYYLVVCFVVIAYCSFVIKAIKRKREGAVAYFIGFITFCLFSIHDLLYANDVISNSFGEMSSVGVFIFFLVQAFVIAERFAQSFVKVEKLSKDLIALNQHKDEFLANTTHELKTPLNGIISITESLKNGVAGPLNDKQWRNLQLIEISGRRLNNLIDDLLDYSKLKHGSIEIFPSHLRLDVIVNSVVEIHKHILGDKPIHIMIEPIDHIVVFADENKLVQILHNVIGNAVKYTNSGTITISAKEKDEKWIDMMIQDTGIGIPSEKQDLIFQSFEQLDSSLTREYGGIGLGLPITKHLIELHKGSIHVESEVGKGTSFIFRLPKGMITVENREPQIDEVNRIVTQPLQNEEMMYIKGSSQELVIIVDDDLINVQALINILSLEGYSIIGTTDSMRAWEMIEEKKERISLVVTDVMMPRISGFQLCKMIRERWTELEIPVLMMTANHQQETMLTGFESGTNDYLVKPFESEELRARVRTILQMKATMTKVKEVEMAFLQAQIKPHFLFNTLNTIEILCLKDPSKASDLLNDLATYLRRSFDFEHLDKRITLGEELELVEAYLNIEKARFGNRIQIEYNISENLAYILIPQLVIQPLVENAVRHGIMKKSEGGKIKLTIELVENTCRIYIADDGVGMSKEKWMDIFYEQKKDENERIGIGLRNIDSRLRKLYGRGLELTIEKGTTISFCIPLQ